MITVAYIVSTLKSGGPTNQLSYIVKYLDKSKFKPIIITLSQEESNSLADRFIELGVEHISLNLSRVEGIFKARKKIIKLMKKNGVDIIHTQGIRADIISAKYLKKYKRVCTLRNYPYYDYIMTYGRLKGYIMAYLHLQNMKKIDSANACSKSVSKMLKERNDYSINYIQNGVDLEYYHIIDNKQKIKLRERINLPINKKIFISVGHLNDRKDPLTIIRAFKKLDNYMLIFLGDGNLKEKCLVEIADNDNIKLIGYVANVKDYLQASDYFISASKAEGLPNTVIEAMACGLPCILSNISPHKEIIELDNKAGRIFEVGNYIELSDKIQDISNGNYNIMSRNAFNLVEKNLSAKKMSQKYQKLYIDIL